MRRTNVPFRRNAIITAFLIVVPSLFMLFQFNLAGGLSGFSDDYEIKAVVPTAGGLAGNARVTMSGAEVGRTTGVEVRGNRALVTMRITDESVLPIPEDTTVSLRSRTALNENYMELSPGRSREGLESGAVLPVDQSDEFVDVDQILSLLQGKTRARAQQFFQATGGAVDGKGKRLNSVFDSTGKIFQDGGELTLGIVRSREQAGRLVDQFGRLTRTIGDRGEAIRTLASRGGVAMRAIASRDEQLGETLDELPETLRRLQSASKVVGSTSGRAAPVLTNLAGALTDLRPGIKRLEAASTSGLATLEELRLASKPLQRTLANVRSLSKPSTAAFPQLAKVLCEANPFLRYVGRYDKEIVGTLVGLGSASNTYDAAGHLIRVTPLIGDNSLPGLPDAYVSAVSMLRKAGVLGKQTALGWDPYPPPGALTDTKRGLGIDGPTDWPGTYERIKADC